VAPGGLQSYTLFHPQDSTRRPAALLFHGLSGSVDELKELADHLHTRNFNVSLPLLTGHGTEIEHLRRVPASAWIADAESAYKQIEALHPASLIIIGLSFGSLLGLYFTGRNPNAVHGLVLLSVPIRIRSQAKQRILCALSYLPDSMLDRLGIVEKKKRPHVTFSGDRVAYSAHSIGSLARLEFIRRAAFRNAGKIRCPVLALQDPGDHHLLPGGMEYLKRQLRQTSFSEHWVPGGEHELTIGPRQQEVFQKITDFVDGVLSAPDPLQ
jgi:carboxylesterase